MLNLTFSDWVQVAVVGVSAGSLAVAIGALVYSIRSGTRQRKTNEEFSTQQHKLQERMVLIEENKEKERRGEKDRADIYFWLRRTVSPIDPKRGPIDYLYFENKGQAKAENVSILIDSKPILEHPGFKDNRKDTLFGMEPQVPAIKYRLRLVRGIPAPPYLVTVNWVNASGKPDFREDRVHLEMA